MEVLATRRLYAPQRASRRDAASKSPNREAVRKPPTSGWLRTRRLPPIVPAESVRTLHHAANSNVSRRLAGSFQIGRRLAVQLPVS
jgi:hypothetical protein